MIELRSWPKVAIAIGWLSITTFSATTRAADDGWGPESNGVRCRLVAVPTDMDDENPDSTKSANSFVRGSDVAFAIELKNVGDKSATLLGVRYGDSHGSSSGKLANSYFGPHLFEFEFTDKDGKPVPRPHRVYLESMLHLSSASAHEIAPGKSLIVLLRPAKFISPMEHQLPPGSYQAKVRYRGPTKEVLASIKKHWPDKPQAKAWSGEVTSNEVVFSVAKNPGALQEQPLYWGEPNNGVRAAVEFRPRFGDGSLGNRGDAVPLNTAVNVVVHLENVSDQPVSIVSETWRQDDHVTVKDEAGKATELRGTWFTGWPVMVRWTLQPGEAAEINAAALAIVEEKSAAESLETLVGKTFVAKPGTYLFRYDVRIGGIQMKDGDDKVVAPAIADWQGQLATAETPLVVRARTAEDDARDRAAYFTGSIEFVGKDGQAIDKGKFTARGSGPRKHAPEIDIHQGAIEIPNCSPRSLLLHVRAAGYEELWDNNVQLKPNETRRIELTPATPARFRVVSATDGKPIAGAMVRYFNKTTDKAIGGPIPMDGIKGPVWALSATDGTVTLDTLQKIDPHYADQGSAVYFFYVEDADFAGTFVGPVRAGDDLGDVKLGFPLEVRGEIRGTKEELKRFAAEWDQPFEQRTANPNGTWVYAVSQRLETKRVGDKLTFHLKDLRPGKLRIISNFGPTPHNISHSYGRRDPKDGDVVAEFDLTESTSGLIITPQGKAQTPPGKEPAANEK
jgi:hypothetical protein